MTRLLTAMIAGALLSTSALAQSEAGVTFNLFDVTGFEVTRFHTYSSAERTGPERAPSVHFDMKLPIRDAYRVLVDDAPDGGVVKFNFVTQSDPVALIENFHILDLDVPLFDEVADPNLARGQAMADFARTILWPQSTIGFEDPQILDISGFRAGGLDGVHLIGSYIDPEIGAMLLRIALIPHPDHPKGIAALNNINLQLVPVQGPEDLLRTLGQSLLENLEFDH